QRATSPRRGRGPSRGRPAVPGRDVIATALRPHAEVLPQARLRAVRRDPQLLRRWRPPGRLRQAAQLTPDGTGPDFSAGRPGNSAHAPTSPVELGAPPALAGPPVRGRDSCRSAPAWALWALDSTTNARPRPAPARL